ncbi:MAG: aconitase/3-isopropylmalate dehydratase large subunit family protein, partial [Solirubrobacteraceae bacterium]
CTYGALGAFGSGLGSTDIAAALANGEFWQPVPATIRVRFDGEKRGFVSGKDLILAVIAEIGVGGATNAVLEFVGEGARALTIDERMAVANMAVEAGAETGLFAADDVAREYLAERVTRQWSELHSDEEAQIAREVVIDLDGLGPLVAAPHSPGNVMALDDAVGTAVEQVYIGNCANGTITDLRQAADVFRGRRVHPRSRAVIVPATQAIYRQALREGLLDIFVEAGAMVSTPTCGACFGGGMGVPAAGETAVTTTNRNFKGRMGSPDARVYLANAWVAAAAAVSGELIDPAELIESPVR